MPPYESVLLQDSHEPMSPLSRNARNSLRTSDGVVSLERMQTKRSVPYSKTGGNRRRTTLNGEELEIPQKKPNSTPSTTHITTLLQPSPICSVMPIPQTVNLKGLAERIINIPLVQTETMMTRSPTLRQQISSSQLSRLINTIRSHALRRTLMERLSLGLKDKQ